jgi:hypothetical protein
MEMAGVVKVENRGMAGWKKLALLLLLSGLALILSACSYPGKGDCKGVGNDSDPTSGVATCVTSRTPTDSFRNEKESGPWYIQWIIDAIRTLLISTAAAAINITTGIFNLIFNQTASLDFAGCSDAWGPRNPLLNGSITCAAHGVWWNVTSVSVTVLLPLLVLWKLFSSGFLGAVIEEFRESMWTSIGKLIITGLVLYYLNLLYTSLIGFSELLFNLVLGGDGYQTVADIGFEIRRTAATLEGVQNLGMLALLVLISLLTSLVFLALGIAFFARTVLIIIMYVLSGPAVIAAASDEFRGWFLKWWQSVLALVISPLPVAVCLLLVQQASNLVLNASDVDRGPFQAGTDPYSFATYLIYVCCFLIAAAWFLVALTAQSGRIAVGAFRSGMKALGLGAGAAGLAVGVGAYAGSKALRGAGEALRNPSGNRPDASEIPGIKPQPASQPVTGQSVPSQNGQNLNDLGQSMRGVQLGLQELARTGASNSPQLPPPRSGGSGGGGNRWPGDGSGYSPSGWGSGSGPSAPAAPAATKESFTRSGTAYQEPGYYRVVVESSTAQGKGETTPPPRANPDVAKASYRYVSEEELNLTAYRPGTRVNYESGTYQTGSEEVKPPPDNSGRGFLETDPGIFDPPPLHRLEPDKAEPNQEKEQGLESPEQRKERE